MRLPKPFFLLSNSRRVSNALCDEERIFRKGHRALQVEQVSKDQPEGVQSATGSVYIQCRWRVPSFGARVSTRRAGE